MPKCIHCRIESVTMTREHAFPSAWYTDNTPINVQRWTVPSCSQCNNSLGAAEMDLLIKMVPCIDPNKPEISGLRNKVFEALGIGMEGKISAEELRKRKALAKKVFGELKPYNNNIKVFPNFGLHEGFPSEAQHVINIPSNILFPVLKKVFRGAEYKLNNKKIIEPPFELEIFHTEKEIPELEILLRRFGRTEYLGPGFKLQRVASGSGLVLYKVVIWGTWVAYGLIDLIK